MPYRLNTPFMADNPRITVIGCGGTGGFVAEALCRLYTGRQAEIVLVDHDRVEPHNLLRQNFLPPGRGKAQKRGVGRAVVRVLRTNSRIHRQTLPERGKPDLPGNRAVQTGTHDRMRGQRPGPAGDGGMPGKQAVPLADRRRQREELGTSPHRKCAASRGIGYLIESGETRRKFLGQPTHLEAKA